MHIAEGQQVVVGYDFSPTAETALRSAIDLASRSPRHVLHILVAVDDAHPVPTLPTTKVDYQYTEKVHDHLTARLADTFAAAAPEAHIHFFVHVRIGKPGKQMLALAEEVGADLIIVGSHGWRGLDRVLFGSVSEEVVRGAGCPVMVVRPKTYAKANLLDIVDAKPEQHHAYVRPHRYSYSSNQVITRPNDWPLS
ncbi:MAG: universal stress protein [Kofleriaceae bacterium]